MSRVVMVCSWVVVAIFICGMTGRPSMAQDDSKAKDAPAAEQPKEDSKKETTESKEKAAETPAKPAAEKKAAEKSEKDASKAAAAQPAADDPAAGQAALAEYKTLINEWKELLKELRSVKQKYDMAPSAEAAAINEEWNKLIERGEALIPRIRTAGSKAYAVAKDDRELERFLIKILKDDIAQDKYEEAYEVGPALLKGGCDVKEVNDAAGLAAFCVNDYDSAEKYLKQAERDGVLSDAGRNFLSLIPKYREYWAKEQEIRKQEAADDNLPRVKLQTSKGDIVLELFENEAPDTVGNFVSLVEKGFYKGLTFHRVLPGFMAQGGCPQGDGSGGPGYNIYDEVDNPNYRKHFRGTLSMAKTAEPDTGGSQFFITFVPTDHLNGRHTAFGRVIEGMDVLAKIQRIDPQSEDKHKPEPDKIVQAEVLRKRDHEYKPRKVQ